MLVLGLQHPVTLLDEVEHGGPQAHSPATQLGLSQLVAQSSLQSADVEHAPLDDEMQSTAP